MAAAIRDLKYNLLRAAPVIWFIHSGPMWPRPSPLAGVYVRGSKGPHSNDCNEKSAPPPPRVVAMCHRTGRCWGFERRFEGLGGRGDARLGGWSRRSGPRRRRSARGWRWPRRCPPDPSKIASTGPAGRFAGGCGPRSGDRRQGIGDGPGPIGPRRGGVDDNNGRQIAGGVVISDHRGGVGGSIGGATHP